MSHKYYYMDIETGPAPAEVLADLMPDFDETEVKTGNLKDEAKIKEKITAAREAHERGWFEKAALSPVTGRVLCVGVVLPIGEVTVIGEDAGVEEADIVSDAMAWIDTIVHNIGGDVTSSKFVIGHNIKGFDLPFLIRRAWALGVPVPRDLLMGRYWSDVVIDTMERWGCGIHQERISLDSLARFFGVGQKSECGKDFHVWWDRDRAKAIQYLKNDLTLTEACFKRMTV
jgi:cell wall-associated NlpC family hydrolase